jgi:hypothetical protein
LKKSFYIFLFCTNILFAQKLEFNAECKSAYQEIFKFKFENGKQLLQLEKNKNPNNTFTYFIENYIDFFTLYISEDKSLYNKVKQNIENRLDRISASDKNSPYYLYTQAEIHLQWALCKLKFKEYIGAIFEIKKAYSLLNENQKKYPKFKANLKSLGFLHTIFGAVPENYKTGAKILGLKGSIPQGLEELHSVIEDKQFEFREEAIILYTFLQLHLNKDQSKAWNTIANQNLETNDNILFTFVKANVAQHLGKNDEVINIIQNQSYSKTNYPIHFLDYMLGNAYLQQLNDKSINYLLKYINNFKGNSYIKECYRKIAWYYVVKDKPELYFKYMQLCKNFKEAITDEDKSAQKEAERNLLPNKYILQARILFDGNYLNKALEKINQVSTQNLKGRDVVEFYYRKARIYDKLNLSKEANDNYILTINKSNNTNYYFGANACVQLARYFEEQNKKSLAIQYYNKALLLPKDEYENSINAEAKAGLNRLQ